MGKIFFNPKHGDRGGFLHEGISVIPDKAVEITKAEFDTAFAGQANGKEIWPGPDGKPELRDPVISNEQAWGNLRATRNNKLAATDGLVNRHHDEQDIGGPMTLSEAQFKQLLGARQALRDLPATAKDPHHPDWPDLTRFGL